MRTSAALACLFGPLLAVPTPALARIHWIGGFKTISVAQDCEDGFMSEDCQKDINLPTSREALADGAKCKPAAMSERDRDKAVIAWLIKHGEERGGDDARSTMHAAGEALWPCPQH